MRFNSNAEGFSLSRAIKDRAEIVVCVGKAGKCDVGGRKKDSKC